MDGFEMRIGCYACYSEWMEMISLEYKYSEHHVFIEHVSIQYATQV